MRAVPIVLALLTSLSVLTAAPGPGDTPLLSEDFAQVADGALPAGSRVGSGEWAVRGGRLEGRATEYLSQIVLPVEPVDDVAVEVDVAFVAAADTARWLALAARKAPGAVSPFVQFTSRADRSRPNGLELGMRTGGDKPDWRIVRVGSAAGAPLGESHRLRFEVRGGRMRGYVDGAQALSCSLPPDAPATGEVALVLSGVTAAFDNLTVTAPPLGPEERRLARTRPLVIAHRGGSVDAPENTVVAVRAAFDAGADAVEVDVRKSRDGQLYLLHDATLERTTDGEGKASDKTLAELQDLDAGAWKGAVYAGERIPTLAEAAVAARGRGPLVLDLKEDGLGELIAASLTAEDDILVCCWREAQVLDIQQHLPAAPIVLLGNAPQRFDRAWFAKALTQRVQGYSLAWPTLSPELIRAAHLRALTVYAWTINDPQAMAQAVADGVDGVITDDPAKMVGVLAGE